MDSPLGAPEIIILLAIVIILFGGKNLRQLGDELREAMQRLRHDPRSRIAPAAIERMTCAAVLALVVVLVLSWFQTTFR
jgi:hypothetical protein